ncbi:GntR family transcriptional regulator [Microbacterium sediminicola]|uniref:GntR family transcriptional regulator n=1 Tax=Microbacterium sediminicola TaxID=415210 RepID=A0ABP4TII8_9MICO
MADPATHLASEAETAGDTDVTSRIRDAILQGEFAPHQRLIEADLSERFLASRATVRSALMHLVSEGLVERLPNKGARVRSISVDEAIEIVEVRVGLESLCARKAAERVTDAEADELRQIRDDMTQAVAQGNLLEYSRLNQLMDARLRQISGHATASVLLERLRAQSARHQFRLAFHPGRATESAPEHAAIIDAVIAHDGDAAEAATRQHLCGIATLLRAMT